MTINDYYAKKKAALAHVEDLYNKGLDLDKIIYSVTMRYGFGESVVLKHIKLLKRLRGEVLGSEAD